MKFLVLITVLLSLSDISAEIPGDIKLESFLKSIENGGYTFKPVISSVIYNKMIDLKREDPNHQALRSFVAHQKIKYPQWDWDNLYFRLAIIDGYEYRVAFTPETRTCTLAVDKRSKMERYRQCEKKINRCLYEESQKKDPSESAMKSCFNQNGCKFKPFHSGESIDKKYCEKLYGRKL